jgi:hypothetical protein
MSQNIFVSAKTRGIFQALVEGDVETVQVYLRSNCEGIDMNYRNVAEVDKMTK